MGRRKPTRLIVGAATILVSFMALSCTPEAKHNVLTFFFDGVPPLHPVEVVDPKKASESDPLAAAMTRRTQVRKVEWYEHKPAGEMKSCRACHDVANSFTLSKPAGQLCADCHGKEARAFPVMHGPVAIAECGACHEAHRSRHEHLIKAPVPELCFQCHEHTPEGGKTLGCSRASDAEACMTCHDPHGGAKAFFLVDRPGGEPSPEGGTPPTDPEGDTPPASDEGS